MVRPRNERKRVEREERARLLAEDKTKGNATDAGESDSGNDPATHTTATEEEPKHVNFNLFRRNMGEWLVEIAAFKKAYPAVYEEEYNTRIDAETALYIHRWREVLHTCIDTYTQKQHTSMQTHVSTNTRKQTSMHAYTSSLCLSLKLSHTKTFVDDPSLAPHPLGFFLLTDSRIARGRRRRDGQKIKPT